MKSLPFIILLAALALIFSTCKKPPRDNPWDELAVLNPQSWAPKNIQISTTSITERTISWEYTGDNRIEGFKIDRRRGNENWVTPYNILSSNLKTLSDSITINPTVEYHYRIYAYAGKNNSSAADTLLTAKILAPEDLTYTINSPTSITLNWDYTTSGHQGFQLERKTNGGAWSIIEPTINPDVFSYTDDQVNGLENIYYAYRISAFVNSYFSDYSIISEIFFAPNVTNPVTGKTWMDRNLGASRVAQSSTDEQAYGDLYQWGRRTDGHENRTSGTTSTLSSSDTPGHGNFILAPNSPYDWRSPKNDNLWQSVNGTNNPCPPGYRLPTEAEWQAERQSWSSNNAAGAFNSPLKLPVAGNRIFSNGSLSFVGSNGYYWSATVSGAYARFLVFNNAGTTGGNSNNRAYGYSVRCLKD